MNRDGSMLKTVLDWLGLGRKAAVRERWTAAFGALLAVLAVFAASGWAIGEQNLILVTSMGSSAVLLFSSPHSSLSQPWPLVGGHVLAATIGVSCAAMLGVGLFSAGLAVGLAVLLMQWTRSTHPPAGATALAAVIGGDAVINLGWLFIVKPVLLNALLLLISGLIINWPRRSHRYPLREIAISETDTDRHKE